MTLTEFLLARIAEEEHVAQQWPLALDPPPKGHAFWIDTAGHPVYEPRTKVLAECEAKRRIVEIHGPSDRREYDYALCKRCTDGHPCDTLRLLALPYADHPDYREEWRP